MTIGAAISHVEDLGMAGDEVLDAAAGSSAASRSGCALLNAAELEQPGLLAQRRAVDVEALDEVGRDRSRRARSRLRAWSMSAAGVRSSPSASGSIAGEHLAHLGRELRVGEVVDADRAGRSDVGTRRFGHDGTLWDPHRRREHVAQEVSSGRCSPHCAANLGIAIAKFVGFALTGAASLLAEAIHSVADTANQGLLLLGDRRAKREPSESHPFGYARERYFWAFVVSVVLFTAGGLFALYEGIEKLRHPHEPTSLLRRGHDPRRRPRVRGVLVADRGTRGAPREGAGHVWLAFIRRSKSAELPVVLLEDIGALIGLVIALCSAWCSRR